MIDQLKKLMAPLQRRIMNMVARAVIQSIDDSKKMQVVKALVSADEIKEALERLQNYGFTSKPLAGAEGVALFVDGNRDHGVVICVDDRRYRVKNLANGEVCIYSDEGDKIHFKRGNKIEITTMELTVNATTKVDVNTATANVIASGSANVQAPTTNITSPTGVNVTTPIMTVSGLIQCAGIGAGVAPVAGKAKVQGDLEASGNVKDSVGTMASMRTTYNSHTHAENGSGGGTTNPPNQPM